MRRKAQNRKRLLPPLGFSRVASCRCDPRCYFLVPLGKVDTELQRHSQVAPNIAPVSCRHRAVK